MITDERNAVFSPKDPEEVVTLSFDFSIFGDSGYTAPVVTISHFAGITDDSVASMVLDSAVVTGAVVSQLVQAGINDADYLVRCKVTKGTNVYVISGILPVRNAVGYYSQSEIQE